MRSVALFYREIDRYAKEQASSERAFSYLQVLVGMKSGEMVLYDIVGASVLETIEAHSGTIWSIHVRPDFGGVVTGSADKDVKFWDFEDKDVSDSVILSIERRSIS
jgi:WD40 repeat protein